MRTLSKALVGGAVACGLWVASGIGVSVGKSDVRPGGEVGWYFSCIYFAPHRSFEVNYSDASRADPGVTSFWEQRADCPAFANVRRASVGWRH